MFFAHAFALLPGLPGSYLRTAYYRFTLTSCAADIMIGFGSYFAHPEAAVGSKVSIGSYCVLGRTQIGADTQIASHVQILSGKHQHARDENGFMRTGSYKTVSVGRGCWIGAGGIIMADLGAGVTIGAGSVVVAPVCDGVVAAGNPARVLQPPATQAGAAGK